MRTVLDFSDSSVYNEERDHKTVVVHWHLELKVNVLQTKIDSFDIKFEDGSVEHVDLKFSNPMDLKDWKVQVYIDDWTSDPESIEINPVSVSIDMKHKTASVWMEL